MAYSFLDHPDCVKFRAEGVTTGEMFISACDALNETVRGDIEILEQDGRVFEIEGEGLESLLFNFLKEVLRVLNEEDFLVARIESMDVSSEVRSQKSEVGSLKLKCVVMGDKAESYKFTNDVKSVSSDGMFVRENEKGFECQVVLDVE